MNQDEIESLIVKILLMILAPLATKYHIDGNLLPAICADLASLAVLGYGIYAHWNMKKVPENSTAISTTAPMPVGSTVPPSIAAAAKVVGALLIGFLIVHSAPAMAQPKKIPAAVPMLPCIGNTNLPIGCTPSSGSLLATATTEVSTFLTQLADIGGAATLSMQIPGLQDPVGNACWKQLAPVQALIKAHPLPVTLKIASDIEALRLAAIAMNQVCANPNCGQMFVDATNAATAIAGVPIPVSLGSLCAKVPVIGTSVAAAVAAQTPTVPAGQ